jgi:hypothetical protein
LLTLAIALLPWLAAEAAKDASEAFAVAKMSEKRDAAFDCADVAAWLAAAAALAASEGEPKIGVAFIRAPSGSVDGLGSTGVVSEAPSANRVPAPHTPHKILQMMVNLLPLVRPEPAVSAVSGKRCPPIAENCADRHGRGHAYCFDSRGRIPGALIGSAARSLNEGYGSAMSDQTQIAPTPPLSVTSRVATPAPAPHPPQQDPQQQPTATEQAAPSAPQAFAVSVQFDNSSHRIFIESRDPKTGYVVFQFPAKTALKTIASVSSGTSSRGNSHNSEA